MTGLDHVRPERPEEPSWLRRHSQPAPCLHLQPVEAAAQIGRALGAANDDRLLALGAADIALHLRAVEAGEEEIRVALELGAVRDSVTVLAVLRTYSAERTSSEPAPASRRASSSALANSPGSSGE